MTIPPRPKELRLNGVEPCKLFTEAQLDELKVTREPRSRMATSQDSKQSGPECILSVESEPFHDFAIRLITLEGIEPWLTGSRNVDAWLVSVGGFPAADFKALGTSKTDCSTAVGVAQGQQLVVTLDPITRAFSQEQMCQMSERVAGMALQTLQTLK